MKGYLIALIEIITVLACGAVAAETAITRPMRFIVLCVPGGSADTLSRLLSPYINENLNQQVIVDNRGGDSSTIGTQIVAKAAPNPAKIENLEQVESQLL